ncbi:G-type lectin S-receptor-like serine/threonine-protein kinase At2g19130 [Phragmites australis]|uniref:G-type lectin S-receptor-like serine/threonine-protein kinase At2g19130 n=1 Tax=Phragmites australis TaxID=29695 RepID=UPI002D79ABCB|nr:G-type lectin S-receptor-like serine/threonine-protein kinase At2g19130 [Phragmites australis]
MLILLLLFSTLNLPTSDAIDTLTLGQSLPWNQTLVSKGGNFELGLFSPGNSKKHYIGIWFKKISKKTVVWVANRERPILEPSTSRFTLSKNGELLLLATPSNALLWSSNASSPSPAGTTVATLQDDGNLVVRSNATAAASLVAWQSFDHPTNTWLPGARLGYDRGRGVHSFLTSWTDSENPAPGAFSMEIDTRGRPKFDLLAGGAHQYWTTGVWDGEIFPNVPEMRSGYFVGVPYAPNASVNFFSYHDRIPMGIGIFTLDVNGQMRRRQWSQSGGDWILFCSEPHDACDVYGSCGPFGVCSNTTSPACQCPAGFAPRSQGEWTLGNTASGCARQSLLECSNDGFLKLPYAVQLPNGSAEAEAGDRSDKACELSCLRDCSCTAYAHDGAKCSVWKGELVNLRTLSNDQGDDGIAGAVLHLRVAASEVPPASAAHSWKKSMVMIGSGVAVVVLLLASLVIVATVVLVLRKRRGKGKVTALQGSLLLFDYQAVKAATRDFTEKLGSGSFGSVYKGALPDATPVAVKKLDDLRQGEKQFRAEVVTLGMIHHINLVRLRGFCSEGHKRVLVYDYMPNGSLDAYLFKNSSSSKVLSWSQRFGVAVGVARGLAYLHEKCRECIIHCDIKPENILLDEEMGAKLADFGMAKLVGHEFSRVLTTMRGTLGYLAPEWLTGAPVTAKADVYSFGLLLFELVSGSRNNAPSSEEGGRSAMYFPVHAAVRLHAGDVVGLLDERLAEAANVKELERVCKVACWCIQDEEGDRPTMGLVVQQLEGVADVGLPPIPSRLHMLAMVNGCISGGAEDELCSMNGSKSAI